MEEGLRHGVFIKVGNGGMARMIGQAMCAICGICTVLQMANFGGSVSSSSWCLSCTWNMFGPPYICIERHGAGARNPAIHPLFRCTPGQRHQPDEGRGGQDRARGAIGAAAGAARKGARLAEPGHQGAVLAFHKKAFQW